MVSTVSTHIDRHIFDTCTKNVEFSNLHQLYVFISCNDLNSGPSKQTPSSRHRLYDCMFGEKRKTRFKVTYIPVQVITKKIFNTHRKKVMQAVIIRQRKTIRRKDGSFVYFEVTQYNLSLTN